LHRRFRQYLQGQTTRSTPDDHYDSISQHHR
jgi:hypothetical protein